MAGVRSRGSQLQPIRECLSVDFLGYVLPPYVHRLNVSLCTKPLRGSRGFDPSLRLMLLRNLPLFVSVESLCQDAPAAYAAMSTCKGFIDDVSPSTHDRRHGATRVAEETLILVMQSHDDDCRQSCSERGKADLMFSHQKPTGYGGFREEPSKAPEQCTPAQAAKLFREERLRTLPATGG